MKTIPRRNRCTVFNMVLIVAMPLILIAFLSSQMALRQVVRKLAIYREMPEITEVAALQRLPPETDVMLRGRVVTKAVSGDLIVYQERPADGREVRFRETFEQHFPAIELALSDRRVRIIARPESEYVIQHAPHAITIGDRQRSGFQPGDLVTVQGRWRPEPVPTLAEVTGMTGMDKAGLLSEWQLAIHSVKWVSRLAGLLSALGMGMIFLRVYQWWAAHREGKTKTWMHQTTTDVPVTSRSLWWVSSWWRSSSLPH